MQWHIKRGYSDSLQGSLQSLKRGVAQHIALLGPSGRGKRTLLLEHLASARQQGFLSAFLNLEKTSLTPEEFAVAFVSRVASALGKQGEGMDFLLSLTLPLESASVVRQLHNELLKIKPGQEQLLELAFSFPHILARELQKQLVIGMQEFYALLSLNNFSQIKDVMTLFHAAKSEHVSYVVTTRYLAAMEPYLPGFHALSITPFNPKEVREVAEHILGKKDIDYDLLYVLTQGHPSYVVALCQRLLAEPDVKRAFILETLDASGMIYQHCRWALLDKLSQARGETLLKSALLVLAKHKHLRLTETARFIYRSAPVTKSLLERLMAVDLIIKKEGSFSLSDSVLSYFITKTSSGFDGELSEQQIAQLMTEVLP
ncbi:hypothetical protein HZB01_05590 [Candidatus Woesearchaeota archaeon]|nr:hypothetical protein [Candidatus Woesearchaeota archaeon]